MKGLLITFFTLVFSLSLFANNGVGEDAGSLEACETGHCCLKNGASVESTTTPEIDEDGNVTPQVDAKDT